MAKVYRDRIVCPSCFRTLTMPDAPPQQRKAHNVTTSYAVERALGSAGSASSYLGCLGLITFIVIVSVAVGVLMSIIKHL